MFGRSDLELDESRALEGLAGWSVVGHLNDRMVSDYNIVLGLSDENLG